MAASRVDQHCHESARLEEDVNTTEGATEGIAGWPAQQPVIVPSTKQPAYCADKPSGAEDDDVLKPVPIGGPANLSPA